MKYTHLFLVLLVLLASACGQNPLTTEQTSKVDAQVAPEQGVDAVKEIDVAPVEVPLCVTEVCDGIDNDCDGETDEYVLYWWHDDDGDGSVGKLDSGCVFPPNAKFGKDFAIDCNDHDASVNKPAKEVCGNGVDDNCNGITDVDCVLSDKDCAAKDAFLTTDNTCVPLCDVCKPNTQDCVDTNGNGIGDVCEKKPASTYDWDQDGSPASVDCNDYEEAINPGATEVCGDALDNNCDGVVDDGCNCPDVKNQFNTSEFYAVWCNKCTGECQTLPNIDITSDSYKLVVVYGGEQKNWPYMDGLVYAFGNKIEDLAFSVSKKYDDWSSTSFIHNTFVEIDLDPSMDYVSFNSMEYPGKWTLCGGTVIDKIETKLTLPEIFLVKNGTWTKVNDKVELLQASDLVMIPSSVPVYGSGYPQTLICTATLKL